MKKLLLLLILSFFSTQGLSAPCPDGSEPTKTVSADGSYYEYKCEFTFPTSCGFTTTTNTIMPNFKVAFIGDQGLNSDAEKVLDLIVAESADLVVVSGDFGYNEQDPATPRKWDSMMRQHLGDILYVGSIGNHDVSHWSMYQYYLEQRLNEAGICWSGDLGVNSHLSYKGLFIVLSGVGTLGDNSDSYIRDSLAVDDSMWRVVSWHKNHIKMQVGGKETKVKWPTYEICRKAGAIVATGHEHSYSRTYMLTDLPDSAGSSTNPEYDESRGQDMTNGGSRNPIILQEGTAEGSNFVFVSGLGGMSIRNKHHNYGWMAETYTAPEDPGVNLGALFIIFHVDGQPDKARGYFKDIDGDVIDEFEIVSHLRS